MSEERGQSAVVQFEFGVDKIFALRAAQMGLKKCDFLIGGKEVEGKRQFPFVLQNPRLARNPKCQILSINLGALNCKIVNGEMAGQRELFDLLSKLSLRILQAPPIVRSLFFCTPV